MMIMNGSLSRSVPHPRFARDPVGVHWEAAASENEESDPTPRPAAGDRHDHQPPNAAVNMTQEVQELLEQVEALRQNRNNNINSKNTSIEEFSSSSVSSGTSPRSTMFVTREGQHSAAALRFKIVSTTHSHEDSNDNIIALDSSLQREEEHHHVRIEPSADGKDEGRLLLSSFQELSVVEEEENDDLGSHHAAQTQMNHHTPEPVHPHSLALDDTINHNNDDEDDNTSERDHDDVENDATTSIEALRQAARAERDAARQWARQLRSAVYQWVEQQKILVQHYNKQQQQQSVQNEKSNNNPGQAPQQQQHNELLWNKLEELEQRLQTQEQEHSEIVTALRARIRQQKAQLLEHRHYRSEVALDHPNKPVVDEKAPQPQSTIFRRRTASSPMSIVLSPAPSPVRATAVKGWPITPANTAAPATATSKQSVDTTTSSQKSRTRLSTANGGRIIIYSNGAVKEIHRDWITVRYLNGDVQTETAHDRAYYYSATGVVQVNYYNNNDAASSEASAAVAVTEYHYPNGQVEEHWTDGSKTVRYPDGHVQHFSAAQRQHHASTELV